MNACGGFYLYSYYFTGLFWSLRPTYGHSFRTRALKFSAKFAIVQRRTVVKFVFGCHPHSPLQAKKGDLRVGLETLLLTLEHQTKIKYSSWS